MLYQKLLKFAEKNGHARVPKGYTKDKELANWVRNQRLEYANMQRGKKSRMDQERLDKLNASTYNLVAMISLAEYAFSPFFPLSTVVGFKWSTSVPYRAKNPVPKAAIEATVEAATAVAEAAVGSKENKVDGELGTLAEPKEAIKAETSPNPFVDV